MPATSFHEYAGFCAERPSRLYRLGFRLRCLLSRRRSNDGATLYLPYTAASYTASDIYAVYAPPPCERQAIGQARRDIDAGEPFTLALDLCSEIEHAADGTPTDAGPQVLDAD